MRRPGWFRSARPPKAERQARPASQRDRLAVLLALVTLVCLGSVFFLAKGTTFLMPGPLASAHGAIENCGGCHTKSGSGKLSWIHGLVAGDPLADSKACLTCHKMQVTAFNAHSASTDVLKQSTERLTKTAAGSPAPQSARAQSIAFPTHDVVARGLNCATCHQEHQGVNFKLSKISNEQCRSCHVVKFDSFDGNHPKFDNYPFNRRTRIIYDHTNHFGKHYPEVAKKDPAKRIPATCSDCHNSRDDKRIMAVAPFDQTCTTCHLDQIIGKERVSGPKGIAFLTLPGLDLEMLKKKNASIGEWPDASEAPLSPFMKVLISRNEQGRALIKTVDSLNLQDLTNASDDQIKAVTNLVWEMKGVFYALIKGKASDVLGDLNIDGEAKLSAALVADLTASIPRDVVISAQQEWLPNLATEMANRQDTGDQKQSGRSPTITEPVVTTETDATGSASPEETSDSDAQQETPKRGPPAADSEEANEETNAEAKEETKEETNTTKRDPPACTVRILGQCLVFKEQKKEAEAAQPEGAAGKTDTADTKSDGAVSADTATKANADSPAGAPADRGAAEGNKDAEKTFRPQGEAGKSDTANAKPDGGKETPSADDQPRGKATDQSDDLLLPTEEELRAMKALNKDPEKAASSNADANSTSGAPAGSDTAAAKPQTKAQPVISIASDVDPESWAEYGGWYRQDYVIFYRPTGHKDKFIYSWLYLTGPQAPKGDTSPAAAVFDYLIGKDAQGSCTKCHSVDDIQGNGRLVNFSPPKIETKQGRFTNFIHEPHFGILENRGCLTCHKLEKDQPGEAAVKTDTANAKPDGAVSADAASRANAAAPTNAQADSVTAAANKDAENAGRPYLKSYEQGNPHNFVPNFGAVKKDLCQTCHTSSMARQDCLLCHKYHVNGVNTPIMNTKIPNL